MTVIAIARTETWTMLIADAVKGRTTESGPVFDFKTEKIWRVGDAYLTVVGDETILRAAYIVASWNDPVVTQFDQAGVFDSILGTASTMRRLHIAKKHPVPNNGATFVVCTKDGAYFWDARLSVNTFERTLDFPMHVPEGRAVILYGGAQSWYNAPLSAEDARTELIDRILHVDSETRAATPERALPYDLLDSWSRVLIRSSGARERGRPFESIDECLEHEYEYTAAVQELSIIRDRYIT